MPQVKKETPREVQAPGMSDSDWEQLQKSAEDKFSTFLQSEYSLEQEIESLLGEERLKQIGQEIALVIAKYKLTRQPDLCQKIFRYMSLVIQGWNSV